MEIVHTNIYIRPKCYTLCSKENLSHLISEDFQGLL